MSDLNARLAELERELKDALEENERLTSELAGAQAELADAHFNSLVWDDDPLEVIEDYRRGLITLEELYEKTVGR